MPDQNSPNNDSGVIFLDLASLDRNDLDLQLLKQTATPFTGYSQTSQKELSSRDPDAWCVIVNKVQLDREFFRSRPKLRLVCVSATGTNNVDLEVANEFGVTVTNCRGYGTQTVAQHVLMLILSLSRSSTQYQHDVASGAWSRSSLFCLLDHPIRELGSLRLGIVGYGAIGQHVSHLAKAFGMEVMISERFNRSTRNAGETVREGRFAFADILSSCNVISLHCPLTPETEQMIDDQALRRMRKDAFLINTARGGLIEEEALVNALRDGRIAGAAVDVVGTEPPPADNPLLSSGLQNLIITPHCAWGSREARQRIVSQLTENIAAWQSGRALRRVV